MFDLDLGFFGNKLARLKPRATRGPRVQREEPLSWRHGITVQLILQPRARRYLLQLRTRASARLVIPRGGSREEALRFLERSEGWLLQRQARWIGRDQQRQPWTDGTQFRFRGEEVVLRVENTDDHVRLVFADEIIKLSRALPDYRDVILRHLRKLAERELPPRTAELAREHGITVHRVTVRAQKTRWGSCSARGTLSFNWRLIQAPPEVRDYLIIHELMHRREMNHSARYWKLVAEACPSYREAEQWLKKFRLENE